MSRIGRSWLVCLCLSGCATIAGIDEFEDQVGADGSGGSGASGTSANGGGGTGGAVGGSQSGGTTSKGGSSQSGGTSGGSSGASSGGSSGSSSGGSDPTAGSDAGGAGGSTPEPGPPSCEGLEPICGELGGDDCCESPLVGGDTFFRDYDGVNDVNDDYPATVSDFRLDRYEITVGRFRAFVAAWLGGWRAALGDGKHSHLNGGVGLSGSAGTYEAGWDNTWNGWLATTSGNWDSALACEANATWTSSAGNNENKPINCISWYEATAFCIWDGGFLPSEAEWNFAAAGGAEQRYYPWSAPASSTSIDCDHANYSVSYPSDSCVGGLDVAGFSSPDGDGLFGQADMAGSLWELTFDWYHVDYLMPCVDCARNNSTEQFPQRQMRGGGYSNAATAVRANGLRASNLPENRDDTIGARCARAP